MSSTLIPSALLLLLATACQAEWEPHSTNTPPEATLDGTPTTVTRGELATFEGTVADRQQGSAELTVAWSFEDRNGTALAVETAEDCTLGPQDSATLRGRVACTARAPTDLDTMTVVLVAADAMETGEPAALEVGIDPGASPTCTLYGPTPQAPDGAYFSDVLLPVDGVCADAVGETIPADLALWFRSTWHDEHGQTLSEEFRPSGGDTAALDLIADAGDSEVRLYGSLLLPAADHQLCLFAEDESGNRNGNDACVDLSVEPPNTAPWCEILLPRDATTGNVGDEVHFEGLVGDGEQDASTLVVTWRTNQLAEPIGYGTPSSDGRVSIDTAVAFTEAATHKITLVVDDVWGERCTDSIRYTVGDGPSVHIDAPADGDVLDIAEVIAFEGTFSDGHTDPADLELSWESSQLEEPLYAGPPMSGLGTDIFLYDPADPEIQGPLPEGRHIIYLYVTDEDGNLNADMIAVDVGDCTQDWYRDLDADGYGDDADVLVDCTRPTGYTAIPGDCADSNASINPGAVEQCNGLDDNCDGTVDEGYHTVPFYRDADGDGYGDDAEPYPDLVCSSATLSGYSTLGGDCDDTQPDINPGEPELCDDTDHDCDGTIDNGLVYPYGTVFYLDIDGDGYGSASTTGCAAWTGWILVGGDCDDADPAIHPGATEVCDATPVDNDCDGDADPVGASGCVVRYQDADGDGYGTDAGTSACVCASNPGAYTATDTADCDDGVWAINPGADEACDAGATDEDCDGDAETEDALGCSLYYDDTDGDNYYATGAASRCLCAEDGDYRGHISGDCDESDAAINPGVAELCDGLDNDCDGLTDDDDGSVSGGDTWYRDADGDGYGLATVTLVRCAQPTGYVADSTDCDDSSAAIHPGAAELCDGANTDEDCDGVADDADSSATGQSTWYRDTDSDGYGVPGTTTAACDRPTGYAAASTDCDDGDASIHPGATEICDASDTDEDCDGVADDDDSSTASSGKSTWYRDADSDTYGTSATTLSRCDQPSGYVSNSADCNDSSAAISPAATEICDASDTDEDCNGVADDSDSGATGKSTWYRDADSDTYGTSSTTLSRCNQPSGYVSRASDCSDSNRYAFPGAAERESSTSCREDADADGYGDSSPPSGVTAGGDCDDGDSAINPGASETAGDAIDYNCDGYETCYVDSDHDGYRSSTSTTSTSDIACTSTGHARSSIGVDCLDSNANAFPGAAERESSTSCREDADGDGYGDASPPSGVTAGSDCDDAWDLRNPELRMNRLITLYNSSRNDHLTTIYGSSDYTSKLSAGYAHPSGYSSSSPLTVGYSVATMPAGADASIYDDVRRGWSSGCTDHATCMSISTLNSSYAHGCSTYSDGGVSLGYLPDTDLSSYTRHWYRCYRSDWHNHRMTYSSSVSCNSINSAYYQETTVHWIFTSDISSGCH
ncbi:MAG: MopE-related protein [Pseudomonadota bacterium]